MRLGRLAAVVLGTLPLTSLAGGCNDGGGTPGGSTAAAVQAGPPATESVLGVANTRIVTGTAGVDETKVTFDAGGLFGAATAFADFNGDGRLDLAVGVPGARVLVTFIDTSSGEPVTTTSESRSGAVLVFPADSATGAIGDAAPIAVVPSPTALSGTIAFGSALAAADLDGDGFDDLVIGAPGNFRISLGSDNDRAFVGVGASADVGSVHIAFGAPLAPGSATQTAGTLGPGDETSDQAFGTSIATGDLNGDGSVDLVIGAPASRQTNNLGLSVPLAGAVWTALLATGTASRVDLQALASHAEPAPEPGALFGLAVATGDVNGDGRDDVIVGAPLGAKVGTLAEFTGEAHVFRSSPDGKLVLFDIVSAGVAFGLFGRSVAAGDVDGDGLADLVVGAPFATLGLLGASPLRASAPEGVQELLSGQFADELLRALIGNLAGGGETLIYRSERTRLAATPEALSPLIGGSISDGFGWRVATADFDGDGRADILASAPFRGPGTLFLSSGSVFAFRSRGSGGALDFQVSELTPSEASPPALRPLFGLSLSARGGRAAVSSPIIVLGAILLGGIAPGDVLLFDLEE